MRRVLASAWLVGGALAVAAASESEAPADRDTVGERVAGPYDPLRGMDPSGRIPRVALPEDLPDPERWRYVPEGRIAPGNVLERFLVTSFIVPLLYYEKDIGAGGGVGITDIDFREQRRREFAGAFASRSTEGQEDYTAVWQRALGHRELPGGGVAIEDRSFVRAIASYDRSRTRRFFGFGAHTAADDETSFTDEHTQAHLMAARALPELGGDWVATGGLRADHHNLTRGRVSGRPSTGAVHPELFAADDGGDALWTTLALRWDTRDSEAQPYRGGVIGAAVDVAPLQDGGQAGAVGRVHGLWAVAVPSPFHDGGDAEEENPPTDTVVAAAFVTATTGDVPFYDLPSLGGAETLRGYIGNRFTDRAAWHAAVEYRCWPVPRGYAFTDAIRIERLGLALFYELGSVAATPAGLLDAPMRDSYGIGLRLAFERMAVFRIDLGFSREGSAVTVDFGTSF